MCSQNWQSKNKHSWNRKPVTAAGVECLTSCLRSNERHQLDFKYIACVLSPLARLPACKRICASLFQVPRNATANATLQRKWGEAVPLHKKAESLWLLGQLPCGNLHEIVSLLASCHLLCNKAAIRQGTDEAAFS